MIVSEWYSVSLQSFSKLPKMDFRNFRSQIEYAIFQMGERAKRMNYPKGLINIYLQELSKGYFIIRADFNEFSCDDSWKKEFNNILVKDKDLRKFVSDHYKNEQKLLVFRELSGGYFRGVGLK